METWIVMKIGAYWHRVDVEITEGPRLFKMWCAPDKRQVSRYEVAGVCEGDTPIDGLCPTCAAEAGVTV